MQEFTIPFGRGSQSLILPESMPVDWIDPADQPAQDDPREIIESALRQPSGERNLADYSCAQTAAIVINDKTRPVPNQFLLSPLLARLKDMGLERRNIRLFIANGTHLPMPAYEFNRVLPEEIIADYPVISHDCDDTENLVHLGVTSRGTEVWVNRLFYQSDLKIVTGDIEPHHFAGFSGGMKTAAIGLAGRETINHNHALLLDPHATIGEFEQNPLRQDIEEIGRKLEVHFALNAVLNAKKEIVTAFFGDPEAVLQAGIPASRRITETRVSGLYDLVIASAGGHPKDINLYQAQKALTHVSRITRPGGTIILVAACPEGSGSEGFERFMQGVETYEEVFEKFTKVGFQIGPHKAVLIARIASRIRVILVSQLPAEWVARWLITPAPDLQAAYALAELNLPAEPRVAILPHATNTIAIVTSED